MNLRQKIFVFATLEPSIAAVMEKHEVQLPDALTTAEELAQRLGARAIPIEEDRNLAAIARHRILRPKNYTARLQIKQAFEKVKREPESVRDVLLTIEPGQFDGTRLSRAG